MFKNLENFWKYKNFFENIKITLFQTFFAPFTIHSFLNLFPIMEGVKGVEIWVIIEIGMDMYIYSWSESKQKLSDSTNVRLSVCLFAKLLYTKTHERIKIIKFGSFVWKMLTWNRHCPKFDTIARRFTK